MNKIFYLLHVAALLIAFPSARAQDTRLTLDIPSCLIPSGKTFPEKYEKIAKNKKEYAWLLKASPLDSMISGKGGERADQSEMYDWLSFYRVDLNNDGICDWYVNDSAPISTGGDRDTINTIYLGSKQGWIRIGAQVPSDKPDELGFGNTDEEQARYQYGEDISVIYDATNRVNYFVTAFYDRHVAYGSKPGYRIMAWDENKKDLHILDKWEPKSKAAAVYAFFKLKGARRPAKKASDPDDTIEQFDPDVEAFELEQACNPKSTLRGISEYSVGLSRHLLARCKH
jgi:hypothetical protein